MSYHSSPSNSEIGCKNTHVLQGEFHVSDDPSEVLTTVLGSCVAACLYDPVAQLGGMNHFLLPISTSVPNPEQGFRYGAQAMELLINALVKLGARKSRLEAKLFGGGQMDPGLGAIGDRNAAFARQFLQTEGIPCVSHSLGGTMARRLKFWPTSGLARQMLMPPAPSLEYAIQSQPTAPSGEITLFEE